MPTARGKSSAKSTTRATYSADTKAAAVAALLAGQSVSQVARQYELPKGTVSNWKIRGTGVPPTETQKDATPSGGQNIGDLLVTLLETNIKGLIAASAVLQDTDWVRSQDASELGVFIGITHDKVVRMLEAMDRSATPTPAQS
jgi:transposase-like protein